MESSKKGWIKLHRNLLEDDIWTSSEPFSKRDAWIDLLLNAAYKKEKEKEDGKDIDILPGQILTSFLTLSRRWRWSRDKVRSFLRQCPHIQIDRVNRQTGKCLITIENWDVYQSTKGSNRHTKTTTKSTPRSIYKEEEKFNGMEQPVTAPAEEDDDGMTMEEYLEIWGSTNSTDQTLNDSSVNRT